MTRVALTGLGFMGKTHLGVYQKLDNVEVTAICDVAADRLDLTSLDAGGNIAASSGSIDLSAAKKYTSFAEMLAAGGFDFVDLCLPTNVHAAMSVEAMTAGYHVFCEKPMALTAAECDAVVAAVKRTGRRFSVGQCLRFWPAYTEVKKLLDSGTYGKLRYAEYARFSAPPAWGADNWLLDGRRSGNAALDLHVHDVDMVLFLHGAPKRVRSRGVVEADATVAHIATTYDFGDVVVTSTGGWLCSDAFGFNMRAFWVLDGATIELDFSKPDPVTLFPRGGKREALRLPEGDGYFHELADFVRGIEHGHASDVVTAASAAESVKLCLLEIESAVSGRELAVKL